MSDKSNETVVENNGAVDENQQNQQNLQQVDILISDDSGLITNTESFEQVSAEWDKGEQGDQWLLDQVSNGLITEDQFADIRGQTVAEVTAGLNTPVVHDIQALKAKAGAGTIEFEEIEQLVVAGEITAAQFEEILGVEYEPPARVGGIGDNNPPDEEDKPKLTSTVDAEMQQSLKTYRPLFASTSVEAMEHVKEALVTTVEYLNQGNTSLTSKGAIAIADYIAFNAGMTENGNTLITVNSDMHRQVVSLLTAMVPAEDIDMSFKTRVSNMAKRAILLMAGKIHIGYFVLPADRKAVRANDEALSSCPNPSELEEGARIMQSTCIFDGVLTPSIPVEHKGSIVSQIPNSESEVLRLLSNEATEALFASMLDKDGKIQYHPTKGHILGFKSGKTVADEALQAKAKADALAADPVEPEKRQTRGTQAEPKNLEQAKARISDLQRELAEQRKDAAAKDTLSIGDVMSVLNTAGAFIRDTNVKLPEQATVTMFRNMNDMLKRRFVAANHVPTEEEMRGLTEFVAECEHFVRWDADKGTWSWHDVNGNLLKSYTLNGKKLAA